MSYPADCLASNVPPSGVVVATVPRIEITTTKADNWSSRNKNYVGNVTMAGGGAFGKQYAYSHNQAEHYLTEGYTEYIELRIPEPMYVVMVRQHARALPSPDLPDLPRAPLASFNTPFFTPLSLRPLLYTPFSTPLDTPWAPPDPP